MKPPTRSETLLILGMSGLIAGIVILLALQKEPLVLSKEEAPFPSIHMPPQAVYGSGYMDGGSIGIVIVDLSGARHDLTFPIDYNGIRNAHPSAFFGTMNDAKQIPLKHPERAKEIALRLLDEYGKEFNDPYSDDETALARRSLSSPPDAVVNRAYKKARRVFGY